MGAERYWAREGAMDGRGREASDGVGLTARMKWESRAGVGVKAVVAGRRERSAKWSMWLGGTVWCVDSVGNWKSLGEVGESTTGVVRREGTRGST